MNYWDNSDAICLSGYELKTFLNKKRIVNELFHADELSGSDFSKLLHTSTPRTNSYLAELIDEGYVEIRGKANVASGRKPLVYGLNKNAAYVVGVDVGRTFLNISIFNNALERVAGIKDNISLLDNKEALLDYSESNIGQLLEQAGIPESKLLGVGVSMPGLIDSERGFNYTFLTDGGESLAEAFGNRLNKPVFLENDTKARTKAEMRHGLAKESDNALVIQIDAGLGLGLVLDGKLYRGNSGFAGEFSHIPIEEDGILCNCGKVGCLETLASCNALVRITLETLENDRNSKLYELYKTDYKAITPGKIIEAAHAGDQLAIRMISQIGLSLGKGLSYLIQTLNPKLIIVGGKLAEAREYLTIPIIQSINKHCLPKMREDCELLLSKLGSDSGVVGAATIVLENMLKLY